MGGTFTHVISESSFFLEQTYLRPNLANLIFGLRRIAVPFFIIKGQADVYIVCCRDFPRAVGLANL